MSEALVLKGKSTALVLIDLQHGILERELAPYAGIDVARQAAKLAASARAAGALVVYVHVDLNATLTLPADNPTRAADSPAAPPHAMELVPEAGFQPATDILILKRQWGAFYATDLDQQLRRRGIRTIVLAGVASNLGVESTARAAQERGYALVFASDAMSTRSDAMQHFALETIFPLIGRVRTAAEIEAAFSSDQ